MLDSGRVKRLIVLREMSRGVCFFELSAQVGATSSSLMYDDGAEYRSGLNASEVAWSH